MMNIRRLRVASVSVAVSVLWTCAALSLPERAVASHTSLPKIIVVGAGMAGLVAAQSLRAFGFPVTVLEARNRVGGRLYTETNATGTKLDLGASWIHGHHPQFEAFVASMHLDQENTDYTKLWIYNSLNQPMIVDGFMQLDLGLRLIDAIQHNMRNHPDRSIRTMVDLMWWGGNFPWWATPEITDNLTTILFETEYAATATNIPCRMFWELIPNMDDEQAWESLFGSSLSDNKAFPGGFSQVTDRLKEGLDIKLNSEVTRIDYPSDQNVVTVTTKDGMQDTAQHVIVTVPIGVLKWGSITFTPPLPSRKLGAIQRMGSGVLNKLYLEFPSKFWPDSADIIGTSNPQRGGFAVWVDMSRITKKPILMAFTSGDSAVTIESWSPQQVQDEAMKRLRDTFNVFVPNPINRTITRWNQDPYARGSYSHFALGTQLGDRAILREPAGANKVLFAGEATVDAAWSQVPGAFASGIREAERVIQLYAH
jgi:monoamine oxidase